MRKYNHTIFYMALLLCKFVDAGAQNLVPNPSFEIYTACPPGLGYIPYSTGWDRPINHMGSVDYYNTCAVGTVVNIWNNFMGGQAPATGNAYAGLILKNENYMGVESYREYLQGRLTSPLVAGQMYRVSFKCSLSDFWEVPSVTTNALSVYLSTTSPTVPANYTEPISLTPQFNGNITFDTSSWTLAEFNYTASGGEEYIVFGNFKMDSATYASPAYISQIYAFIDDISVKTADIIVIGNHPICPGENITLTASQSLTYAWAEVSNPNMILSTSASIILSPQVTTTYYVYGNVDTAIVTVQVKTIPSVNLGNDTVVCSSENLLFAGYNNGTFQQGTQYVWSNGNTTPFLAPTQSGTYWVQGILNGCVDRDTINIVINTSPSVNLGADRDMCPGDSLILHALNNNSTYTWQDNSHAPTFVAHAIGKYFVTVNMGNCSASDTIIVSQSALPTADLGNDISSCLGNSITLNGNAANDSFLWSDNSTLQTLSITQTGTYWIKVRLGNCYARDTIYVIFHPLPIIELGNDTMPCFGSSVILNAYQPNVTYSWQDNSNLSVYTATQSGIYKVQITDTNQCSEQDLVKVTFVHMPVVEFSDTTLCEGKDWKLDINTLGATYLWQDQSSNSTFWVESEGTYWAVATNACGSDSDTLQIAYERCDCNFFVPNTFTQDGNGVNETFYLVAKDGCDLSEFTITFFNRWGQIIYESQNIETDWDGSHAPLDTYTYRIAYKFDNSPLQYQWGLVTLLK
jgi:hypothetical protein